MLFLDLLLQLFFWGCVIALVHTYAIYPRLVVWLAGRKRREHKSLPEPTSDPSHEWPYLVVAMAAHNEEAVIEETLLSILQSDYPTDRFEIIIAADNCNDGTHAIVESLAAQHDHLTLKKFPGRNGKIRVINQVLSENRERFEVQGDYLLILCDANVRWDPSLTQQLARHFKDPKVGLVAPIVLDSRRERQGIADYEEAYVSGENRVKQAEGDLWGRMMGAFGACYAIRGKLVDSIPETFIVDDFYHTMRCFELGYDAIVEPKAKCFEDVSEDIGEEFRRKKRITIGNFQNLSRFRRLLLTGNGSPATVFAFWSHKGFRWIGPFLIIGALVSSLLLAGSHPLYALALAGQLGFLAIAAADLLLSRNGIHLKLSRSLRYFYLMNLALLLGAFRFIAGVKSSVWEPTRRVAPTTATAAHASLPTNLSTPTKTETSPVEEPASSLR